MKALVIGGSGTVGRAVAAELAQRHEIASAGREHGEQRVDITNDDSVEALFKMVGPLDAIVVAAGGVFFGPLATMRPADLNIGLQGNPLGQARVTLLGQHLLRDGGSLTLTEGIELAALFTARAAEYLLIAVHPRLSGRLASRRITAVQALEAHVSPGG